LFFRQRQDDDFSQRMGEAEYHDLVFFSENRISHYGYRRIVY